MWFFIFSFGHPNNQMRQQQTTKMTDPTTYPIILGRFDSWQYFVRDAEASEKPSWESQEGMLYHAWGYQVDPKQIIGCFHFQKPMSQPKVMSTLRSLFVEGSIQVEPLTSIKQISRTIRSIKELDNTFEVSNKVSWYPDWTPNIDWNPNVDGNWTPNADG